MTADETARTRALPVLIVEDEDFDALNLERALVRGGVTTDIDRAGTLREARTLLATREYGALILDHRLPDGLGAAFAEEVAQSGAAGRAIMIMVTSEPHEAINTASGTPPWQGFIDKDDFSRNALKAAILGEDAVKIRTSDPTRCAQMLRMLAIQNPAAALRTVDEVQGEVWHRITDGVHGTGR